MSIRETPVRPAIVMSAAAKLALDQAQKRLQHVADGHAPKSSSELLSQLWKVADGLMCELAVAQEPLPKRLAMCRDAAKLIPELQKAELKQRTHVNKKAVEDMTDAELRRLMARTRKRKQKLTTDET